MFKIQETAVGLCPLALIVFASFGAHAVAHAESQRPNLVVILKHPEKVRQLVTKWNAWAKRVGASSERLLPIN